MTPSQAMVELLHERGIGCPHVIAAMRAVPREEFVLPERAAEAYDDRALPLTSGQTISQPYVVALMAQALRIGPRARVLEIGAGSGYSAAVLAQLARRVYTIERIASLGESARERLARLRISNVEVRVGDGSLGWPEAAPFDAIAVTAAGPHIPQALLAQLAIGGALVMPVGDSDQHLVRVVRHACGELEQELLGAVQFVPLIGAQAWGEHYRR